MQDHWIRRLRCPQTASSLDLDATRQTGSEIVEGFLVSEGGRAVWLVLAGVAVMPRDLHAHLREHGHVYRRTPIADSRVVRFVLGRAGRGTDDRVPFDEVLARYSDLVPPDAWPEAPSMAADDAALAALLAGADASGARGLDIGCGVGRSTFVLRAVVDASLGVDRSLARVRRARNVASTASDFHLPGPPGAAQKEIALELSRLDREGVDFAVADAEALPFTDAAFDVVVLRGGDGRGAHTAPQAAAAQATRVLTPEGLLVRAPDAPAAPRGWKTRAEHAGWTAWNRA